jgi:phage terminase small subunit
MSHLTVKQTRFAQEYVHADTAVAAARAAGYKTGARVRAATLIKNPLVQQIIEEERRKLSEQWQIKRDQLVAMLLESYRRAESATEMVASCRELGKLLNLYEPEKKQITTESLQPRDIEAMSDEELLKVAGLSEETL